MTAFSINTALFHAIRAVLLLYETPSRETVSLNVNTNFESLRIDHKQNLTQVYRFKERDREREFHFTIHSLHVYNRSQCNNKKKEKIPVNKWPGSIDYNREVFESKCSLTVSE